MSKILTSYKEKENAIALAKKLKAKVRHLWVMIMQPRPSYKFYDVEIQSSTESPCSKEQTYECEEVLKSFIPPIEETKEIITEVKTPETNYATVKSQTL